MSDFFAFNLVYSIATAIRINAIILVIVTVKLEPTCLRNRFFSFLVRWNCFKNSIDIQIKKKKEN